jgi:hypothetical protein
LLSLGCSGHFANGKNFSLAKSRWHVHCPGKGTEDIVTFGVAKFKSNRIFKNVSKSLAWVWSREQINETNASRKSVYQRTRSSSSSSGVQSQMATLLLMASPTPALAR